MARHKVERLAWLATGNADELWDGEDGLEGLVIHRVELVNTEADRKEYDRGLPDIISGGLLAKEVTVDNLVLVEVDGNRTALVECREAAEDVGGSAGPKPLANSLVELPAHLCHIVEGVITVRAVVIREPRENLMRREVSLGNVRNARKKMHKHLCRSLDSLLGVFHEFSSPW